MRLTSPDPLGRVMIAAVGGVALIAAIVVPTVTRHDRDAKPSHPVAGAVAPAAGGLPAPLPRDWLRLRPPEKHGHKSASAASPPKNEASRLPSVGTEIPPRVLRAYVDAAKATDRQLPSCRMKWNVLAGIGFIESGHAHSGGSDDPQWNGLDRPGIYGPLLDGTGKWPAFADTDGGRLDGNRLWDRAVGPMQFMPSTWSLWGADGNDDGHADPQQIDDAALAAAHYLCAAGGDLSQVRDLHRAVFAYNHDNAYVRAVLSVAAHYAGIDPSVYGVRPVQKHHKHRHHARRHRHRRDSVRAANSAAPGTVNPTASTSSRTPAPSASTPASGTTPTPDPTQPTPVVIPTPTDTATPDPSATPSPTDTSTGPAVP